MAKRIDYAKLNQHEREVGLLITEAPPPKPPRWWKRNEETLVGSYSS
jgi:hypothetical protein